MSSDVIIVNNTDRVPRQKYENMTNCEQVEASIHSSHDHTKSISETVLLAWEYHF